LVFPKEANFGKKGLRGDAPGMKRETERKGPLQGKSKRKTSGQGNRAFPALPKEKKKRNNPKEKTALLSTEKFLNGQKGRQRGGGTGKKDTGVGGSNRKGVETMRWAFLPSRFALWV